jgi:hypothetical protein
MSKVLRASVLVFLSFGSACGPPEDPCARPVVMSDIAYEGVARGVCEMAAARGDSCHVCVQAVSVGGVPSTWSAVFAPASCGCGSPRVQ